MPFLLLNLLRALYYSKHVMQYHLDVSIPLRAKSLGLIIALKMAIAMVMMIAIIIGLITSRLPPPFKLLSTKLTICVKINAQIKLRGISYI